jgi:hypothetical protein
MSRKPCKHGHRAPRRTKHGDCTVCRRKDPTRQPHAHYASREFRRAIKQRQRRVKEEARDAAFTVWMEAELRLTWQSRRYACSLCNEGFEVGDQIDLEHHVPLSRNGRHSRDNVGPAHSACNGQKGTLTLFEWLFAA